MANEFYALMGRMRYITRWGLMRNTFSENIQEHSHQVAVLAHALALIRRGVTDIEVSDSCTWCESDRFWSHRVTKGDRGSQGAIIVCKEVCK